PSASPLAGPVSLSPALLYASMAASRSWASCRNRPTLRATSPDAVGIPAAFSNSSFAPAVSPAAAFSSACLTRSSAETAVLAAASGFFLSFSLSLSAADADGEASSSKASSQAAWVMATSGRECGDPRPGLASPSMGLRSVPAELRALLEDGEAERAPDGQGGVGVHEPHHQPARERDELEAETEDELGRHEDQIDAEGLPVAAAHLLDGIDADDGVQGGEDALRER